MISLYVYNNNHCYSEQPHANPSVMPRPSYVSSIFLVQMLHSCLRLMMPQLAQFPLTQPTILTRIVSHDRVALNVASTVSFFHITILFIVSSIIFAIAIVAAKNATPSDSPIL